MNWRDQRLGLQLGHALSEVALTRGCDVSVLISGGRVAVVGQVINMSDLDVVLGAVTSVPGVREVAVDVAVAECDCPPESYGQAHLDN